MEDTKSENGRPDRPVYLVGMMGAGKSTIGPALAKRLGRDFVDTDDLIEERAGRSIPEIFAEDGEAYFRRLEQEAIDAASASAAVVALGGGAFSQPGTAERLRASGIVVFLDAPIELLLSRVGDGASRPLLAGLSHAERQSKLESLRDARAPDYAQATFSVDAQGKAGVVVDRILAELADRPPAGRGLTKGKASDVRENNSSRRNEEQ
ncbi:MAG: shikimate kinase [Myxococcota bacterium]